MGDDAKIDDAMRDQLRRMAETQGGKVPLHGRLFAQWLHYAFPRECAFPHRAGTADIIIPSNFSVDYLASASQIRSAASGDNLAANSFAVDKEDQQWMSQ